MKLTSIVFSFSFVGYLSVANGGNLLAAPLKFTPTAAGNVGEIACIVPVHQIGDYYPPSGSAVIKGNAINIQAVQGFDDAATDMLAGEVFDSQCDTSRSPLSVTGLAYFDKGSALTKMDNNDGDELVFARQGSVRGKIQQINMSYVVVQKKDGSITQVDRNLVILIRSPHAYRFSMAANVNGQLKMPIQADVQLIEFKPTLIKTALPSGSVIPHPLDDDDDDL